MTGFLTHSARLLVISAAVLAASGVRADDAAQTMPVEIANADAGSRVDPTDRPGNPTPQHPELSTPENTDTHKPPHEWQRATDDWMGSRPWLEDRGISFNASLSLDITQSFRGGASTRDTNAGTILDANLTLDAAKLFKLEGGTFFVNFQAQGGTHAGVSGAVQEPSDAALESRTQVSELWYEQKLFGEKLRLKLGKMDANTDFSVIETAEDFLNGAFAASPAIFGLPTHPDPAAGVVLFAYPTENLYAGAGVFDGRTIGGRPTGAHALSFSRVSTLFLIAEAGAKWSLPGGREGHVGVGAWHVTGDVPTFGGGTREGACGPYAFVEQQLWRAHAEGEEDERGVSMFLQYGSAGASFSPVFRHIGGGLAWTGPCAARPLDVVGVGVSAATLGHDPAFVHSHETVG
ncbi:MAG TPA: carbohydrate porin, partial [Phycisphaerae bacterium]|nr:carbohydrate porin [Phycisphaerae bacterium]